MKHCCELMQRKAATRNIAAKNFKVNRKSFGFERAHRNGLVNFYVWKKIFSLDWHVLWGRRSKVKLWLVMHVAAQTGGN